MQAGQTNYIPLSAPLACFFDDAEFGWVIGLTQNSVIAKPRSEMLQQDHPLPFPLTFHIVDEKNGKIPLNAQAHERQTDGTYLAKIALESKGALEKLLAQTRKNQHIEICQHGDVESSDRYTGFEDIQLTPCALPDLDWKDLDTSVSFLGKTARLPFLITGMTGGIEKGAEINQRLAEAAQACGIPMGVGSQRIALEHPECETIFKVRKWAPDIFLIANLGIAQLRHKQTALMMAQKAIDMIEADAIAIHMNVLQELVQTEGDRNFSGIWESLVTLRENLSVPIIVKEVGSGMDLVTAQRLQHIGIDCLDVGGRGGTSWSYIESKRTASNPQRILGEMFRDWGIPTAQAVAAIAQQAESQGWQDRLTLIATGGIRSGLTAAKALGLGAHMCGIGLPLFKAALVSTDHVIHEIRKLETQLKVAMIASGCARMSALSQKLSLGQPYQHAIADRIAGRFSDHIF